MCERLHTKNFRRMSMLNKQQEWLACEGEIRKVHTQTSELTWWQLSSHEVLATNPRHNGECLEWAIFVADDNASSRICFLALFLPFLSHCVEVNSLRYRSMLPVSIGVRKFREVGRQTCRDGVWRRSPQLRGSGPQGSPENFSNEISDFVQLWPTTDRSPCADSTPFNRICCVSPRIFPQK